MWKLSSALLLLALSGSSSVGADPARELITSLPQEALPLSEYYYNGQVVLDRQGQALGDVNDVVLDREGRLLAVIIGVGGLLGAGEKNVAVPFDHLKIDEEDGKGRLVADLQKSNLETAPGFEFDQGKRRWVPAAARTIDQPPDDN